jgi:hypothetical protein
MKNFIWIFFVSLMSMESFAIPNPHASALKPKSAQKALDLLAQGGAARVYSTSILADVQNLNCTVNRAAQMSHKANATICVGVGKGGRKLSLTGEKANELYSMLESVKAPQSLPAADSVEIQRLSCSFTQKAGAHCRIIK